MDGEEDGGGGVLTPRVLSDEARLLPITVAIWTPPASAQCVFLHFLVTHIPFLLLYYLLTFLERDGTD